MHRCAYLIWKNFITHACSGLRQLCTVNSHFVGNLKFGIRQKILMLLSGRGTACWGGFEPLPSQMKKFTGSKQKEVLKTETA